MEEIRYVWVDDFLLVEEEVFFVVDHHCQEVVVFLDGVNGIWLVLLGPEDVGSNYDCYVGAVHFVLG